MKNNRLFFSLLFNVSIGAYAVLSTSDAGILFWILILAFIIQISLFATTAFKKLFNIPNIKISDNTLIYRGIFNKKSFDLADLAIEKKSYSNMSFYTLHSTNSTVSIPDYDLSEEEKEILLDLFEQSNAELA